MKKWAVISLLVLAACSKPDVLKGKDELLMDGAQSDIKQRLTDPDSAQFRNLQAFNGTTVCGEVNAKNRMGGYVGFMPFVYQTGGKPLKLAQSDADLVDLQAATEVWCRVWVPDKEFYANSTAADLDAQADALDKQADELTK